MEGAESRTPPSARSAQVAGEPARAGHGTAPSPLMPARSSTVAAHAPGEGAGVARTWEAAVEVEGVRWVVRALGRAGCGRAPLLLLGFFDPLDPREPRREALVIARSLDGLTELQLEAALRSGIPALPAGARKPFFPEIAARGVKDS